MLIQSALKVKLAFTLAEVLITLGVIGVVAAMTLPTLISNNQKVQFTTQLKRSFSIMNNGFKMMLANDDVSLLSQTEVFRSIQSSCEYSDTPTGTKCNTFYDNFKKYFKVAEIKTFTNADNYRYKTLNGASSGYNTGTIVKFTDGACLIWPYWFDTPQHPEIIMKGRIGGFYIDVNCQKNPNTYGRDIFMFYLGDNGVVYADGSQGFSEYLEAIGHNDSYWATTTSKDHSCNENSTGKGCAARVLEEGMMKY